TCCICALVSIQVSSGSNLRRKRLVERFRSDSASLRSSLVCCADCLCPSLGVFPLRRVRPLACALWALFLAVSPLCSDHLRNWSTPSSTLRIRSATCALANVGCAKIEIVKHTVIRTRKRQREILFFTSYSFAAML